MATLVVPTDGVTIRIDDAESTPPLMLVSAHHDPKSSDSFKDLIPDGNVGRFTFYDDLATICNLDLCRFPQNLECRANAQPGNRFGCACRPLDPQKVWLITLGCL